jgi:hypothetical protein
LEDVSDEEREWHLFSQRLDPIVNRVLDAEDPWDAYHAATGLSAEIVDDLVWMPHGGAVYVAWSDLADLFESGKPPIPEAHAALTSAASHWLQRPVGLSEKFLEGWLNQARRSVAILVERYGDFWRSPS